MIFLVFNGVRCEVVVRFVRVGEIVGHYYLIFLFIKKEPGHIRYTRVFTFSKEQCKEIKTL